MSLSCMSYNLPKSYNLDKQPNLANKYLIMVPIPVFSHPLLTCRHLDDINILQLHVFFPYININYLDGGDTVNGDYTFLLTYSSIQ